MCICLLIYKYDAVYLDIEIPRNELEHEVSSKAVKIITGN